MLKKIKFTFNTLLNRDYCPFCNCFSTFKPFGIVKREHAMCPYCGSLERHRFLLTVYREMVLASGHALRLLHTAPEAMLAKIFQEDEKITYTPIDLFPEKFPEIICIKADVTDLPFEDHSFDVIVSNQVLEHIPNDRKCLEEFQRVLAPDGRAFLTFPVDWDRSETFEDPAIQTPEDRLKYFGQWDHVRLYGRDVEKRLAEFFNVKILTGKDFKQYGNQRWNGFAYCFLLTQK